MANDDNGLYVRSQIMELTKESFRGYNPALDEFGVRRHTIKESEWPDGLEDTKRYSFAGLDTIGLFEVLNRHVDWGTYGPEDIKRIIHNVDEHASPDRWLDGIGNSKPSFEQSLATQVPPYPAANVGQAPAAAKDHDKEIEF